MPHIYGYIRFNVWCIYGILYVTYIANIILLYNFIYMLHIRHILLTYMKCFNFIYDLYAKHVNYTRLIYILPCMWPLTYMAEYAIFYMPHIWLFRMGYCKGTSLREPTSLEPLRVKQSNNTLQSYASVSNRFAISSTPVCLSFRFLSGVVLKWTKLTSWRIIFGRYQVHTKKFERCHPERGR